MARKFTRNYKHEYEYVLIQDRFEDNEEGEKEKVQNPPTFKFKPLSQKQLAKIQDSIITYEDGFKSMRISQNSVNVDVVKSQICGWDNIFDENDKEIKYDPKVGVDDDMLTFIGNEGITEFGSVILNVSKFPDDAEAHLGNF